MSERIKRTNDELKADRPTIDEIKLIKNSFFDFSGYLDSILDRDSLN